MNLIHIDENGLHLVFERKEDGTCKLLHFSALPFDEDRLLHQHDLHSSNKLLKDY